LKASSPSSHVSVSVVDLQLTINRFVAETNADPKPFVWTADPKRVLAAVKRGKQVLESIH
jgi:mannose/fructose/N-acetylgalactosamine-specific phosphotransferase system component IIB